MFNKALLTCSENNNPPERGYVKAMLTIGSGFVVTDPGFYPGQYWTYGYRANMFGNLEPSYNGVYNICNNQLVDKTGNTSYSIDTTLRMINNDQS